MKIFITGPTGLIGRNLVDYYEADVHELWLFGRIRWMEGMLSQDLAYFRPDVIIHCAADIYDTDNMFDSNVVMTNQILEYVRMHPATKLINIGSSSEYGCIDRASKETDPIHPIDLYAATKGAATLLCQGYARAYALDIITVRPYSVYGHGEKEFRLFPRLFDAFLNGKPMKLFDGNHDFIYIDDFVLGIDLLVNRAPVRNPESVYEYGDVVNFGSGKQTPNLEVLNTFREVFGFAGLVTYEPTYNKPFESDVWVCDTTYAYEKYGFQTKFNLKQGVLSYFKKLTYEMEINDPA